MALEKEGKRDSDMAIKRKFSDSEMKDISLCLIFFSFTSFWKFADKLNWNSVEELKYFKNAKVCSYSVYHQT